MHGFRPVIDNMGINLIAHDEQPVFFGDGNHFFQKFSGIDHPRGIIRINQQHPGDGIVVFDLVFQVFQIGHPAAGGVQLIGQMLVAGMGRFRRRVGRIGRRRADDPGFAFQEAENLGHRIAQPVEKNDVIHGNPAAAPPIHLFGQECPGFGHSLGSHIPVGLIFRDQIDDDILDPLGQLLPLLDGIADVFPGDLDAEFFQIVGNRHNPPDLIR
ncbi:MAG: hypothetical protein BWY71_02308 [Planctomycetes bacterium ADurb.Bin412]|nr:MAG: hypothetical protein BWY71_02308 [Planctomycetes bacterium ADurb.Bin412]